MQLSVLESGMRFAKISSDEEKRTKESMSKGIPEEPAALQELEDLLVDRLLHKVHEEACSEESGEPKHIDTIGGCESWVPGQGQILYDGLSSGISRV